jgi:hypothetical protein
MSFTTWNPTRQSSSTYDLFTQWLAKRVNPLAKEKSVYIFMQNSDYSYTLIYLMNGWMDGRTDGWMDGRTDEWMDGWMKSISVQVIACDTYRNVLPLASKVCLSQPPPTDLMLALQDCPPVGRSCSEINGCHGHCKRDNKSVLSDLQLTV